MKVAALQMVSGTQRSDNLAMARRLLEQAAEAGAGLHRRANALPVTTRFTSSGLTTGANILTRAG